MLTIIRQRQNSQYELQYLYVQYFMSMQKFLLTSYVMN